MDTSKTPNWFVNISCIGSISETYEVEGNVKFKKIFMYFILQTLHD